MQDLKSARERFKSMHDRFFVIPNAWSVGGFLAAAASIAFEKAADGLKRNGTLPREVFG
jgi:hypothetical protein